MPAHSPRPRTGAGARIGAGIALGAAAALTLAACSGDADEDFELLPPSDTTAASTTEATESDAADPSGASSSPTTSPSSSAERSGEQSGEESGEPDDRSVERSLTFISLGDEGARGEEIGCGDSAVTVPYTTTTITPLAEVMEAQIAVHDREYEDTDLYNVLSMSDLSLASATIDDRHATVELTGEFLIGGVCDIPRVYAQLEGTALQFDNVDSVTVLIDGETLEDRLSLK